MADTLVSINFHIKGFEVRSHKSEARIMVMLLSSDFRLLTMMILFFEFYSEFLNLCISNA